MLGPQAAQKLGWVVKTVPRQWRRHYRRLLRLREGVLAMRQRLMTASSEPAARFSQHMADAASDDFDHDLALGTLSLEQNALYEIEEALKQIEGGTYGVCELTGQPIPAARLAAVPWTRFTTEASARLEKRGALGRAHLGELRSVREDKPATLAETPEEEEAGEDNELAGVPPEEQLSPIYTPAATPVRRGARNKSP